MRTTILPYNFINCNMGTRIILISILFLKSFSGCSPGILEISGVTMDDAARASELKAMKFGMFICWSFSTFSGYEWTWGVKDISFFNPVT